jgi:hypothetical protein
VALYIEPLPDEPNGNGRLMAIDLAARRRPVLDHCSGFAVSSEGWVLAKRRTSRSTHDLLLARRGADPTVIMQGFDFEALAFSLTDSSYACLLQPHAGEPFRLCRGLPPGEPRVLDWAPSCRVGNGATIRLAGAALVLTEPDPEGLPKVTLLDLGNERIVESVRSPEAELLPVDARP